MHAYVHVYVHTHRWVEPCGKVMRATTEFRKNASKPWTVLRRTWYLDETGDQ